MRKTWCKWSGEPRAASALTRRLALVCMMAGLVLSGCASAPPRSPERLAPYRPRIAPDERPSVAMAQEAVAPSPAPAASAGGVSATPAATPGGASTSTKRALRKGDKVSVSLLGKPNPEEIRDVIDDAGNITLPLLGNVQVEGLTTSQAESMIERLYIDGDIYPRIDCIVVAQEDEYFLQGEVARPGRYPLQGELTLVRAIMAAGGYTDYANRRRVKLIRGEETMDYDTVRIEARQDPDPVVLADDMIVVPRRWY